MKQSTNREPLYKELKNALCINNSDHMLIKYNGCSIGCIGIVIVCAVAKLLFSNSFIILCVSDLISVVVYGVVLIIMKNSLTNTIIQVLKKKLKKS